MSFLNEFKAFAMKGNVVDMAVGVIIGGAFGKIVTSIVNDIIMPPIGLLIGGVNFSNLYFNLSEATYSSLDEAIKAGAPVIKYGVFIQTILDFTIVALAIFTVIKLLNSMKKKEAPAPTAAPVTPEDIQLLREIRDALKK
jgi:large conductance mechanosensitive channel